MEKKKLELNLEKNNNKVIDNVFKYLNIMHNPSVNPWRGLCVPGMPGAMLSEGFCALVGSVMANWSWMKDQAKSNSKDAYS